MNIRQILAQLKEQGISTYEFPQEEAKTEEIWMRGLVPFAVVGSNTIIQVRTSIFQILETKQLDKSKDANGKKVQGRSYPWGSVNIEERQHCDFQALRTLLLAHSMQVEDSHIWVSGYPV